MRNLYLKHPNTGKPDLMVTLSVAAASVALFKFLLDGVSFYVGSHLVTLGHVDAMAYGSLLAPVLGAHSYIESSRLKMSSSVSVQVDNPDGNL